MFDFCFRLICIYNNVCDFLYGLTISIFTFLVCMISVQTRKVMCFPLLQVENNNLCFTRKPSKELLSVFIQLLSLQVIIDTPRFRNVTPVGTYKHRLRKLNKSWKKRIKKIHVVHEHNKFIIDKKINFTFNEVMQQRAKLVSSFCSCFAPFFLLYNIYIYLLQSS